MGVKVGSLYQTKKNNKSNKELNIKVNISQSDNLISVNIIIDDTIKPYKRNRTNSLFKKNDDGSKTLVGFNMYDPLSSYKKNIKAILEEQLSKSQFKDLFPFDGYVSSSIIVSKKPPKSWSNKDKYYAIKEKIPLTSKPDIDNFEKTVWDCLNGIIYTDDKIIYKSEFKKIYDIENKTHITMTLIPKKVYKGRLNKEQLEEWNNEFKDKLIYNEKD